MGYAIKTTVILAAMIFCYVIGCKIAKQEINDGAIVGVLVGHIIAQLIIAGIEAMMR